MEEIRKASKAYYENLTEQQKEKAQDDFKNMKLENNKSMSLTDFLDFFLQDNYPKSVARSLFKDLDVNGDGSLDFDEFITLFYLYQGKRLLYCRGCETFLNGLYFTCIKCFGSTGNSYDLCTLCYRNKNFQHHKDAVFLDNYALLRRNIKRSSETAVDPVQENDEINEDEVETDRQENEEVANVSNQLEETENRKVANKNLYRENEENEEVLANAMSNQLEETENRKVANKNVYRKRERIGKAFATFGATVASKVTGRISSSAAREDGTECNLM